MRTHIGNILKLIRHRVTALLMLVASGIAPQFAIAQQDDRISLLADTINLDQTSGLLSATGNVQVFFGDTVLSASSIVYDSRNGLITAQGPLTITDTSGVVILADFAELSNDLQRGLIQGAKLLLAEKMQLVTTEFERTEGRFDTLNNVVASACQVCASRPVPVWQIRARQVIRDDKLKQIHFRNATFEVFGMPVLYLPYMRIPDPSVRRASGFLSPVILSSEYFGDGIKLPYYLVLGDHADATITPTLNFSGATVIDAEYRQRFANGGFDTFGAVAINDEFGEFGRGFLKIDGRFDVFDDVALEFSATALSDNGFMRQYNYDDTDRIVSELKFSRYRNHSYFSLAAAIMNSLRDDEDNDTIPFVFPEFSYRGYRTDPLLGGKLGYEFNTVGLSRLEGEDYLRIGAGADYRVPIDLPLGLRASGFVNLDADIYRVWNSTDFPGEPLISVHPSIGADIHWPLSKITPNARHIFEPVVQLLYTADPAINDLVPNEDSQQAEFDETNLFELNRFPGRDVTETGFRANIGATYTIYNNDGWSLGLAGGLVIRSEASDLFGEDTLLGGSRSDILGAVSFESAPNFSVIGRFLYDDKFNFKRSETQFTTSFDKWDIGGSFVYLAADTLALASDERSEGTIDAQYRMAGNWALDFDWKRDLLENRNVSAGMGVTYGNECIEIGLSLSRRFTSSNNVMPSTDINLKVQLAGFGGSSSNDWPAAQCAY
jgi:LPS-assembly protein